MHARSLVVYSGGRAGHTHNHARRLLVDALQELRPIAEDAGVTLAIEPMQPACAADWTFLTSLVDALAVLDLVASPSVQLAFDAYHFGGDRAAIDLLPKFAGPNRNRPSGRWPQPDSRTSRTARGSARRRPLREVVRRFRSAGYDGDYDVELIGPEIEATDYRDLLQHSKSAFDDLVRN